MKNKWFGIWLASVIERCGSNGGREGGMMPGAAVEVFVERLEKL